MKTRHLLTLCAGLLLGLSAHADTLTFTLDQPDQSASSEGVLSFAGTIMAPAGNSNPVYLNGDAFDFDQPYLLDDTAFAASPATLAAGDSFTGVLFTVSIADPVTDGTFNGIFYVLGGADAASQDVLATERFSVIVAPATSTTVTPEPPSLLLLVSGAGLVVAAARRREAKLALRRTC